MARGSCLFNDTFFRLRMKHKFSFGIVLNIISEQSEEFSKQNEQHIQIFYSVSAIIGTAVSKFMEHVPV